MISVSALYGPAAADLALVEEALAQVTRTDFAPLESMLQSVLQRSGKRIRPAIALLAGGFGRYEAERQVPLAASIELLHTATLVHDDVIDTAETRRGQSTANAMFDNAASVMLGDYMFAHAAELVARTGEVAVIRLFAQTLMTMATGELNQDVSAFDTAAGNRRDYYQRIYGKTASLFATAGAGGAMMAGSQRDTVEALCRYGHDLGMAFQIVDDVLDFSGDADELGKPVGSDLLAGTLTLPTILLLEDAPDDDPRGAALRRHGSGRAPAPLGRDPGADRPQRHPEAGQQHCQRVGGLRRRGAGGALPKRASRGAGGGRPLRHAAQLLSGSGEGAAATASCASAWAFVSRTASRRRRLSARLARRSCWRRSRTASRSCDESGSSASAFFTSGCS